MHLEDPLDVVANTEPFRCVRSHDVFQTDDRRFGNGHQMILGFVGTTFCLCFGVGLEMVQLRSAFGVTRGADVCFVLLSCSL